MPIFKQDNNSIPKTPGEKQFDLLTYWGVGGLLNAVGSVLFFKFTHYDWEGLPKEAQSRHIGKKIHDFVYNGAETIAKPFEGLLGASKTLANGEALGALKHARRFMLGGIIGVGGWAVLAIIKPLEDNKKKIVNYFNRSKDYEPTPEQQAKLEAQPKQSWGSLLGGRAVAFFVPITAAMPIMDFYKNKRGKEVFDDLADITRHKLPAKARLENWWPFGKGMTRMEGRNWTKTIYAELFYTGVAVVILEGVSKLISRRGHQGDDLLHAPRPMVLGPNSRFEHTDKAPEEASNAATTEASLPQGKVMRAHMANEGTLAQAEKSQGMSVSGSHS